MRLDRRQRRELLIVLIIFAVYNLLAFALPFPATMVFWLAYGFDLAAIAAQVPVIFMAHKNGKNLKSRFYGFPLIRLGVLYLCVQMAVSFVIMALSPWVPKWAAVLIFAVILGIFAVGLIAADSMRDEIELQDRKQAADTFMIRKLRSDMAYLEQQCPDAYTRRVIHELEEQLRYSDPVSGAALYGIENSLSGCIEQVKIAVANMQYTEAQRFCSKAAAILAERNELCKRNK